MPVLVTEAVPVESGDLITASVCGEEILSPGYIARQTHAKIHSCPIVDITNGDLGHLIIGKRANVHIPPESGTHIAVCNRGLCD